MSKLKRQLGFCLICGGSIFEDQAFFETDEGLCHSSCLSDASGVRA